MKIEFGGPYRVTRSGMGDHVLYNPNDQYVGRSFDLYGQFSEGELRFLLAGTEPDHTVLDIGANMGAFTVPLARAARRVIAIEPQRLVFQMLNANLALNGITNTLTVHAAAGAIEGQEVLIPALDPAGKQNFGGLSIDPSATTGGEKVRTVTVDGLDIGPVHIIKIDVEGMERDVLLGARATINDWKPALYIENDRADKSPELIRTVEEMGYVAHWHLPPLYSPNNAAGEAENIFPNIVSVNMICWHKDRIPEFAQAIESHRVLGPEDTWERFRVVPA